MTSSVQSPWKKPVFIYVHLDLARGPELEAHIAALFDEGWRLKPLDGGFLALGKIFDEVALSSLEAIQDHLYSHFRLWSVQTSKLWVSFWQEAEPA
jgi:hypothetical protein